MHRTLDQRRIGTGAVLGFFIGVASVAFSSPYSAVVIGPFVAGLAVGMLADSRLDETPVEAFLAGGLATGLLYVGLIVYTAFLIRGSPIQADVVYVTGTFGWFIMVVLLPLFGGLGFLGALLGRPLGKRLR